MSKILIMLSKISTTKATATAKKSRQQELLYPVYFALMGLIFGGVLMLSAMNNFLFFGYLAVSMGIISGILAIHLLGKAQVKRTNNKN